MRTFHLILFIDLYNGVRLSAATVGFSTPVTGLAASRWFGTDEVGIQKMRSIFFERSKSSGVPTLPSAFWRGAGGEVFRSLPAVEAKVAN